MHDSNNNSSKINPTISRKDFLGKSAAVAAGFFVVPRHVLGCACQNEKETGQPARQLDYTTSWLGNSYPATGEPPLWVAQNIEDMYVTADGTVFTNVPWEENGAQVGQYKNGELVDRVTFTGNWRGGETITANSQYVYFAMRLRSRFTSFVTKGQKWYGVCRVNRSDINTSKPFEGGFGGPATGKMIPEGSFLKILASDEDAKSEPYHIQGVAANDDYLAVSVPWEGKIRLYNAQTMAFLKSWEVPHTGELVIDGNNTIWVIQENTNKILRYDLNGNKMPQEINLPAGVKPRDVAIDHNSQLLVADAGVDEQVKIYSNLNSSPVLEDTFGEKGGVYSGVPGKYENMQFVDLVGVGTDSDGNFYVGNQPGRNGSTLIQSYTPSGMKRWEAECQLWMEGVGVDPDNEDIIYGVDVKYQMDYSRGRGKEGTAIAFTAQRHKYPEDPRLSNCSGCDRGRTWIRKLGNGEKYQYVGDGARSYLSIYRFEGEIAVPCGYFDREKLWIDANGNGKEESGEVVSQSLDGGKGMHVDSEGTIWIATLHSGIYKYPVEGFGSKGVPRYSAADREHMAMPAPFTELRRILFYPERNNMMVLNGFTTDNPYPGEELWHFKRAGKVIRRYDNWSPENWNSTVELVPPFELKSGGNGGDGNIQAMEVEGDYIFLARNGQSNELNISRGHVDVYNFDTKEYIGFFEPPSDWGTIGILDIVNGMEVVKRSNGEYIVFLEDNGKAKQVMYRWRPTKKDT